ncbi:hypothetical protein SMKC073_09370 [Serratia marcescens]|nr:hypothetical protein SMKC073_09370 [Serratia marcescens]BEN82113.1 hypothetical protein SMKC103_09370 [Serratia marcescens]
MDNIEARNSSNKKPYLTQAIIISLYILVYCNASIWLLFDGWISGFNSISWIWNLQDNKEFPDIVRFAFFTFLGSILGGGVLSITSFHRHIAINKNFDNDHLWGFIFSPILSTVIGIIIYSLVQSGLLVLTGTINENSNNISSVLGFTAIGAISAYNWDIFIIKLQELSSKLSDKK